jgi:hypothetical protein
VEPIGTWSLRHMRGPLPFLGFGRGVVVAELDNDPLLFNSEYYVKNFMRISVLVVY